MRNMVLKSNLKPPLARSPMRLRARRKALQPTATHSPPGSITKSQLDVEKPELRPEYHTISCELKALSKMVHQELGTRDAATSDAHVFGARGRTLFERGRFYDEYSARRNERLSRKKSEMEGYEKKPAYDLGVRVESAKKREASRLESSRKTAAAVAAATTPVAERRVAQTPRYSLRSGARKVNQKPPLPAMDLAEKSVGVRRIRKAY